METMKRILCVAVVLLCAADICYAEESLEAKLAKLEAASKTRQSASKAGYAEGSCAPAPPPTRKRASRADLGVLRGGKATEADNETEEETGKEREKSWRAYVRACMCT